MPLGFSFFHPIGLSATSTVTYYHQDVDLADGRDGDDDFFIVDAGINYRLPKRYGFLTVGVTNLLDEDFEYFNIEFDNPTIQPDRSFFAKITLALP